MPIVPNFANEWQYIGSTEPVTLFRRLTESTFDAGTAVANAFRLEVKKGAEGGGKGVLAGNSLTWLLWNSQTGNPAPKRQDVIRDAAGIRWSIMSVAVQAWGARYLIETFQER